MRKMRTTASFINQHRFWEDFLKVQGIMCL